MSRWRTETIGDCVLHNADCIDALGTIGWHISSPYDAIITDPIWPNAPDGMFPGVNPDRLFQDFCERISGNVRQVVICMRNDSDPRMVRHIPEWLPFQQVAWCQYVMPGYLGRVLGGNECAYVFGKPVSRVPGRIVVPSVSPKAQPDDRPPNGHPCSRALIHQDWLVNWFSDEGETVLDPFMGSGTTGVACVKRGRKFIGIEIEPKYFDIACRRIEQAYKQPDFFVPQPAKPKQEAML